MESGQPITECEWNINGLSRDSTSKIWSEGPQLSFNSHFCDYDCVISPNSHPDLHSSQPSCCTSNFLLAEYMHRMNMLVVYPDLIYCLCFYSLTVNLLDSRSVMGDLGWVAYPNNGVSMAIAIFQSLVNCKRRIHFDECCCGDTWNICCVVFLDRLPVWRLLLSRNVFLFFLTPYYMKFKYICSGWAD